MILYINFIRQLFFIPHYMLFVVSKNKNSIIQDLYKNTKYKKLFYALTLLLVENKAFRTLFYFRINHFSTKLLRLYAPQSNLFIIDINTKIGAGVRLAHPYATIINASSVGENLYINHLVTIGEDKGKKPVIGNNVTLHANCTVVGGITLGDDVIVGAGAVVVKDVPSRSTVVGNPARIIKN